MFFDIFKNNNQENKDRSHQDNFYSISTFNGEFQYCPYCERYERFEYDRCSNCKNN